MGPEHRSLKIGAAVILGAILLRLLMNLLPTSPASALVSPEAASFMLYMETGRVVSSNRETEPGTPTDPEPAPTVLAVPEASFTAQDAGQVSLQSVCGYDPDIGALLEQPLSWSLTGEGPTVLILHSHTCESYTKTADYQEDTAYRTRDEDYNMLAVGKRLAQELEAAGIGVLHDMTVHDYPSYSDSYTHARTYIQQYLEQYPTIRLVLDLHRDAMEDSDGNQVAATVTVDGAQSARLMLVLGTDSGGQSHPDWQSNLALGVKLHAALETLYPGLCRPISLRSSRFNQDLSAGALLIEVGAAGNTQTEALYAAELLADGIIAISQGANRTG